MENFENWTELLLKKLHKWWIAGIQLLPNIALAIFILIIFYLLSGFIKKFAYNFISKISGKSSITNLFATVFSIVFMILGLLIVLNILNLNKAVASLLAGAGIIGLAMGFAFQDLTANFISGIFLAVKKPFDVGHMIETNGFLGHVEDMQIRATVLRTFQGLHIIIPNKEIFQKPIINYSLTNDRRIELEFTFPSDADIEKAIGIITEAVDSLDYLDKEKKVEVYCTEFVEKKIKVSVWIWIQNHKPPGFMQARHECILRIKKKLSENGIQV